MSASGSADEGGASPSDRRRLTTITQPPPAALSAPKSSAAPTFEQVHAQIDSALTSYWDDLKSLSLTHSALRSQQIVLQTSLKGTQSQLIALEWQQQSEIEAENCEGADQINSQIEAIKAQISVDGRELQRIDAAIALRRAAGGRLSAAS